MSQRSISARSISKQAGAAMSSRLMPPKVGLMRATVSMNSCGSLVSTSISNTSTSANFLNNTALPSITGLPASAPQRSEEHTSELQSLMRISYAVFCLKKKILQKNNRKENTTEIHRDDNTVATHTK